MIIIISINYVLTLIIMIPLTTSNSHLLHWSRQNVPLFSLQLFIFDKKHLWQHKVGSALVSASDKEEQQSKFSTKKYKTFMPSKQNFRQGDTNLLIYYSVFKF